MIDQIEAVQRMQDYIENNMDESLDIHKLSCISGYSPWYSRRLFHNYVGVSPSDYLRKLRLRKSAFLLRDSGMKVIDVALEAGFESEDVFQRAFHREFGCNPLAYSKKPIPLPLFTPYGVKFRFIKRREDNVNNSHIFLQVVDKPARKVIIKRGVSATDYYSYCTEVGCDIWGILASIKSISGEPLCLWLPKKYITPGTSEYVQGVEVETDYSGIVPDGFDVIELPSSKYLMFQGEPFEEDYEKAISEIWDAEKKYDPSIIGYEWDDSNPRIQLEPIGTRGYIEFLPIKSR